MKLRRKLSYANVVSTIALFVALGGATAFAASHLTKNSVGTRQLKANAVTGAKVKNGSITGADVNAATLGKVPSAGAADRAAVADKAALADRAAVATDIAPPEAPHVIGATGEPAFLAGWSTFFNNEVTTFYKDREGIVHLEGRITRSSDTALNAFILPPGYRPIETMVFALHTGPSRAAAQVSVFGDGTVSPTGMMNGDSVWLDGITWRAEQ